MNVLIVDMAYDHMHVYTLIHEYHYLSLPTHTLSLIIGISVGIPIIIVIIVTLIVTYCLCHRYHSRRMQSLMAMYHRRRREEDRQREVNLLAPPPYAVLEEDDKRGESTELPIYTEHDPYQSSNTEGDIVGGGEEENVEIGESEGGGEVSIEQSSNSDQSSSDRAPLVNNGEQ